MWILILLISWGAAGGGPTTATFESEKLCREAGEAAKKAFKIHGDAMFICVRQR